MLRYIVRRLILTGPVLFGILVLVFFLGHVLPGSACRALLGERATDAVCAAFDHERGLDQPIPVQFGTYLTALSHGDLGTSTKSSQSVGDLLIQRLPVTIELAVAAMLFAVTIGVLLGVISAYKRNSIIDVLTMAGANIGVSIPIFVLGLLLAFVFALLLKGTPFALPPSGRLTPGVSIVPLATSWGLQNALGPPRAIVDFVSNIYTLNALISGQWAVLVDAIRHLILPAIALGTIPLAIIARITRSSLLDVLGLDYVRTARAKGLTERNVVRHHGFPNAMLPVTTIVGLQLGSLFGGAVLTETIFNLSGVGRAVAEAIGSRDFPTIQGFVLVIAIIYLFINLVVDVSYAFLDPRVRLT
ncbi:MAG: ABC transporter permease [Chloroflexi bacterium]|nr:ABC transporter permease [Chloroflexota bacterium]